MLPWTLNSMFQTRRFNLKHSVLVGFFFFLFSPTWVKFNSHKTFPVVHYMFTLVSVQSGGVLSPPEPNVFCLTKRSLGLFEPGSWPVSKAEVTRTLNAALTKNNSLLHHLYSSLALKRLNLLASNGLMQQKKRKKKEEEDAWPLIHCRWGNSFLKVLKVLEGNACGDESHFADLGWRSRGWSFVSHLKASRSVSQSIRPLLFVQRWSTTNQI